MNLYQYCGNNPVNYVDPSGFTTIKIWTTDPKKPSIIMTDPTIDQFRNTISSQKGCSIKKIKISGHGTQHYIAIERGQGEGLYYDNGQVVYSDNTERSFAGDIRDKLDKNAVVELNGCFTAMDIPFFRDNISKQLSRDLPGIIVRGNSSASISNEIQKFWNRNQFIRIGSETHVIGQRRQYINGEEFLLLREN